MKAGRQAMARAMVRALFGVAAAAVAVNLWVYFGYAAVMPTSSDFEAGRIFKVQLGGQLWVYVSEREACFHEIVQTWVFLGGLVCGVVGALLYQRLEGDR